MIGRPAAEVFADRPELVERYRLVHEAHDELTTDEGAASRSFDFAHLARLRPAMAD